jgi:hypothetical protein
MIAATLTLILTGLLGGVRTHRIVRRQRSAASIIAILARRRQAVAAGRPGRVVHLGLLPPWV